jgi:hypothetical protein
MQAIQMTVKFAAEFAETRRSAETDTPDWSRPLIFVVSIPALRRIVVVAKATWAITNPDWRTCIGEASVAVDGRVDTARIGVANSIT